MKSKDGYFKSEKFKLDPEMWASSYKLPEPDQTFKNESKEKFVDVSSEEYREYQFPNHQFIRINLPLQLSISSSGGHRIFDATGISHYIPKGWLHLQWKAKEGQPNFIK